MGITGQIVLTTLEVKNIARKKVSFSDEGRKLVAFGKGSWCGVL